MSRECHLALIGQPLLTILFSRIHHQMARRAGTVQVRGPGHKPGDMEHRPPIRMATTQMCRMGDQLDRTQDNLEAHNFANRLNMVHRTEATLDFPLRRQDLLSRRRHQIRGLTERICSFSIFLTTSRIWICTNYFVPMEIC